MTYLLLGTQRRSVMLAPLGQRHAAGVLALVLLGLLLLVLRTSELPSVTACVSHSNSRVMLKTKARG